MVVYPNAKINIGLHIINKRVDGFHNIESVFYPVALCDVLECVENTNKNISNACLFFSHGLHITGNPNNNLIVKAYYLIKQDFDIPPVIVHLIKKIPMGAGLGGGSSNAAFMLKLLNTQFQLKLSVEKLKNYASQLGSDCAFFIDNQPAYLLGKGEELQPTDFSLKGYYLVLLNDGSFSNTAMAYKNASIRGEFNVQESVIYNLKLPVSNWINAVYNDFELSVFKQLPQLSIYKNTLYNCGAIYSAMSGSGSSIYGIFNAPPKLPQTINQHVVFEGWL